MKPSDRETANADFLSSAFVAVPMEWLTKISDLSLSPSEFLVLLQIHAARQVANQDFVPYTVISKLCGMTSEEAADTIGRLAMRGYLSVGERQNDAGTYESYYDLRPLWEQLRARPKSSKDTAWHKDIVTLFEEEFGRPLSGIECEQIRQWLDADNHPEWLVAEALKEAVLASKYSMRYIDRVLFDWQRHRIRSRQDLEAHRDNYRNRGRAQNEVAATSSSTPKISTTTKPKQTSSEPKRDDRYANFYQLFPD